MWYKYMELVYVSAIFLIMYAFYLSPATLRPYLSAKAAKLI